MIAERRRGRAALAVLVGLAAAAGAAIGRAESGAAEAVNIDGTRRGHPISKYIYGQFIEHLGRCIYGGIWAEMLEDRKFYFPVTPDYHPYRDVRGIPKGAPLQVVGASPWEIVGPPASVQMVSQDPFVGAHTPLISAGAGIRQNDLAVVQGKQYVGYAWLKAAGDGASVSVSLGGPDRGVEITGVKGAYAKYPFRFAAAESSAKASLTIAVTAGACYVGTASLMPADHVAGMRADTLALLQELDAPVYRWPGGNFVSGYDWKDGIGDRDRRPPRKNPAWTGVEHNDFGLDEFMTFCRTLNAEPYVVVNSGLGQVAGAVEELQYANGSTATPMGKLRAQNGHPEPYGVKWWGIGNEMYGKWQLGHMPLDEYVKKHNAFAQAMRAEDPSIKLIGVGAAGPWSESMLRNCAEHMDLISEHFYRGEKQDLAEHVRQMTESVRQKADAHRDYRRRLVALQGKDIDIALDEWNYWYGPHLYGELGTPYFLKDALGVAAAVHEYTRQSDIIFMANYAQTVNVIGCIKTTKTEACLDATGLALKLYRKHYGTIPLEAWGPLPLDVAAALSEDGRRLTIGVVNPSAPPRDVPLNVQGLTLAGTGTRWQIVGDDPRAHNEPGRPPGVRIEQAPLQDVGRRLSVAACSATLFVLDLR